MVRENNMAAMCAAPFFVTRPAHWTARWWALLLPQYSSASLVMSLRLLPDTENATAAIQEYKLSMILSIAVRGMRSEHAMSDEYKIEIAIIMVDSAVNEYVQ